MKPLEYTRETLDKRIDMFKITNIQGIEDMTVQLPESGVVRIHAPSEKGKSSIFRAFEPLVTKSFRNKASLSSLVNKNSDTGQIMVRTIGGTVIGLHLDKTKPSDSYYMVKDPEGNSTKYPYADVPQEVLDALGWYTTGVDKQDYCMNVRLRTPLSIVGTSSRLNSEIFNVALNDTQLEDTYDKVKAKIDSVNKAEMSLNGVLGNMQYAMNLPVEDENELEREIALLEGYQTEQDNLRQINAVTESIFDLRNSLPTQVTVPGNASELIGQYSDSLKLYNTLNKLVNLAESPVQEPMGMELDSAKNKINEYSLMTGLVNKLKEITHTYEHEPQRVEPKADECRDLLEQYNIAAKGVKVIHNLCEMDRLKAELNPIRHHKVSYLIKDIINGLDKLEQFRITLEDTQKERETMECPTCKQLYVREETI